MVDEAGGPWIFRENPYIDKLFNAFGDPDFNYKDYALWLKLDHYSANHGVRLGEVTKFLDHPRTKPCRKKRASFKKLKECGFVNNPDDKVTYSQMLPLHELWKGYMRMVLKPEELKQSGWTNSPTHPRFEQLGTKLYRADYHGACLTVLQSKCPSYVGITGIVSVETKNAFKIVGSDDKSKMVIKHICQFEFKLDGIRFTFYGRNFIVRPADRSNKKIKLIHPATLNKAK